MKRVLSIFAGLVIAVLCLYSLNDNSALPVSSAEAATEDTIIQHVRTALEQSHY